MQDLGMIGMLEEELAVDCGGLIPPAGLMVGDSRFEEGIGHPLDMNIQRVVEYQQSDNEGAVGLCDVGGLKDSVFLDEGAYGLIAERESRRRGSCLVRGDQVGGAHA